MCNETLFTVPRRRSLNKKSPLISSDNLPTQMLEALFAWSTVSS
jgi:hypothetical protein